MRKKIIFAVQALALSLLFLLSACGNQASYVLNEGNFFLVMTNMLYFPEQYNDKEIEYDCFTYTLTDVYGRDYLCGVRHCSSGYGCNCGKDTIIGFVLNCSDALPEPKNQSTPDNDKSWVHLKGKIKSTQKTEIVINSYDESGNIVEGKNETIFFYEFNVESWYQIEDASGLHYYVSK